MPSTKPRHWTTYECPPAIGSKHSAAAAKANTASGSTTSTGSASDGRNRVRPTLR